MKKKLLKIIPILLLTTSNLFSQSSENRIAILNLDAVSISNEESITLTDRLRSELVNSGSFTVIERSEMDEILIEQGFQQTGCTTDECAVEIGKLLNINRICGGSVGKVGSLYTVTLRMIDVETGQILITVIEDCQCPIEQVLTSSMKNITQKLVTASKEYIRPVVGGKGDIYVKSLPTAASVFIDGKSTGKTTPTTIRDLETGTHLVKVVKGELVGSKIIRVNANDIAEENISLGKAKGGIKVYSAPVEADIYIGEKFYGRTPKVISDLSTGDHSVKLKKEGYIEINRNITVSGGDYATIKGDLVKPASLKITSAPNNANVKLRGKNIGETPISLINQYPEKVYVEVSFPGYQTERRYVNLQESFSTNEKFELRKSPMLFIDSNPSSASIFINDKLYGKTPLTIDSLAEARVKVNIIKNYFNDWQKILILDTGKDEKLNAKLKAKKGRLLIESIPASASVELDGKKIGITPLDKSVNFGLYDITIANSKFKTIQEKIIINKPITDKKYEMFYKKGQLLLSDLTPGSVVSIDGRKTEPGVNEFSIPIGIHLIQIEKSGYEGKTYNYISQQDQSKSFDGVLSRKSNISALWRSVIFPGWGQSYQEKSIQSWLYPVLVAGGLIGSYLAVNNYNEAVDDYDIDRKFYLRAFSEEDIKRTRAAMDKSFDEVESKESTRDILFITTGAIWLWNILDTVILTPEYKNKMSLSTKSGDNKFLAGVSVKF